MSLTSCIKKAGAALSASDKSEILDAARKYRKQGLSATEAGRRAVDDQIAKVKAAIEAAMIPKEAEAPVAQPEVDAVSAAQPVAEAPASKGFDSEAWDKARADRIKASRDAGNTHLDKVPAYVETMRGKAIYYVHDPKVKGVIRTVDNNGNVYVNWSDAYSAEKELASPVNDGKKTVMQSSIGPRDLKDYVLGAPKPEPVAEDASVATHKDPGEPAEPATPAVVAEAITKAAETRDLTPAQMKAEALRLIDEAIAKAPSAEDAEAAAKKAKTSIQKATISVPGDGTFKVVNTKERLREFRALVDKSPGFASKTAKPRVEKAVSSGNLSANALAREMLDDGEPLNALEVLDAAERPMRFGAPIDDNETPLIYTDVSPVEINGVGGFFVGHHWSSDKKKRVGWAVIDEASGMAAGTGVNKEAAIAVATLNMKKDTAQDVVAKAREKAGPGLQDKLRARFVEWAEGRQQGTFDEADRRQKIQSEFNAKERERDALYKAIMGEDAERPNNSATKAWTPENVRAFLNAAEKAGKAEQAVDLVRGSLNEYALNQWGDKLIADWQKASAATELSVLYNTVKTGKPPYMMTWDEIEPSIDAQVYVTRNAPGEKNYRQWKEAHFEAVKKALDRGWKVPDKVLYDYPSLIRSGLSDNDADLASDAMVVAYQQTKDYGKAVQAYRDWAPPRKAEEAKPAPAMTQSPPVLAGSFSAMRGHVEDGRRVLLSGDRIVTVKSSMNGWELRDESGARVSGPHKSAQELESAVVKMDGAEPAAPAPPTAAPENQSRTLSRAEYEAAVQDRTSEFAIGLAGDNMPMSFTQRKMATDRIPERLKSRFDIIATGSGADRRYWVVPTYTEYLRRRGETETAAPAQPAPANAAPEAPQAPSVEPAERPDIAAIHRDKTLDKQTSENGEVMTRRQWVERKVAEGLKPQVKQEDRIKPMSRMQFFRASNEEQRAHERKIKEAGKKDVYWIGDYEVTKTEHDYAVTLLGASPAQATAPAAAPAAQATPGWHTPLPEQGEPIAQRDRTNATNPAAPLDTRKIVARLATEAVDAITRDQRVSISVSGLQLSPWVLPAEGNRNGVVRLLPEDQRPGAPWQQIGTEPIAVGGPRDRAIGQLIERLRSAPIIASDDPPPGPKSLKDRVEATRKPALKYPATPQGAIDAFNADDSAQAMLVAEKLKIADLQEVGAAIGFRPQIGENAKRFRERLAEVADRLTKTSREQATRERALFDKLMDRAMEFDRSKDHMERAKANGVADDSTAYLGFYRPMGGGESQEMQIPALLDRLASDVQSLADDADFAKVAPMVREKRPGVFDHKPAASLKERVEATRKKDAPAVDAPQAQAAPNDRDHFTLERGTSDNKMEQVTFARGEYITYRVGEGGPWAFGEIDGISHARREFSVDGLWHPFGFAYKAERPPEAKKNTVPLSSVVDEVNAKNGEGLTTADAVSPLQAFKDTIRDVYEGKASVEVYRAAYQRVRDAAAVKAELGKMTKEELTKTFGILRDGKKDELVDIAYESMLRQFALRKEYGPNSYTMTRGGYENYLKLKAEALDALVAGQTAEDLAAFADERKRAREADQEGRAKLAESTKNPKTLEDFRRYIRVKESEGKTFAEARMMLTPEQRALMDDLAATETRSRRTTAKDEQRTQVRVAGQTVDGQIIATKHTKKGHDLYVVKLAERVSREDYDTLNAGAKRIGGYYSSFRGGGAIPGFQFTTREQAEAFVKLAGGDNAAAQEAAQERRNAYEDDRSQTVAERLTEMADRMEEDADESLARDRKVNTTRRARFAASAEQSAREAKAMAKTMRNIAQALTNGTVKFLDRIRTKTQVELLQTYVANAKDAELRAKYPSYAEQEKRKGQPPTAETADYAEFPTFTAYRSDLASLGRQLLEVDGTKKLGERIMKVADDVSEAFTAWAKQPGNFYKVSTFSSKSGGVAAFSSKDQAERAIARSGYRGKAIPWSIKRGEWTVIMSPSEAMARGIWQGDGDKRITLDPDFGIELVEKMGRANRRGARVAVPWQFERAHERRKQLSRMGLETPAEFRAALREFIGLREQAAEADRIKALERAMIGKAKDGLDFFPTPESVADEMIAAANIKPDMAVLEPSAGMGHIADRIRAAGAEPDVIELAADRRELLQEKGYHMAPVSDFLAFKPREFFTFGDVFRAPDGQEGIMHGGPGWSGRASLHEINPDGTEGRMIGWYDRDELVGVRHRGGGSGYDRIVMNPPFSDGRDIEHVRHAYTLLKPGGRLVALMGESAFTNQNKKAAEFREWLDSVGGSDEKLAEGSFMDPSLPVNTGANARMVVIDKPSEGGAALSRAPRVTVATDPDTGAPTFHADDLSIEFPQDTERLEFIDAGRVVNYAITAPDSMEVYGFVELVIGDDGMPAALADIEVKPEYRGKGIGERTVAAILAANPGADLTISNIVEDARGFWARMGVPEQNRGAGEAYDGTLNWQTYSEAADAAGARGTDAASRAAGQASLFREEGGRGKAPRAAPARRVGTDAQALRDQIEQAGVENVNVVQSVGDLPASRRDAILAREPSGRVRGAFFRDDGSIWMVADNIASSTDAAFVLMHEAFHRGLAKTLGADAKRLLRQMYLTNPRLNKLTRDLMALHRIGETEAIEEALADLAGEGRARDLRGWDKLMKVIRDWMAKLGDALGVDLRWSDDMIEDFVAGIRKVGLEGGVQVEAGGASMSRQTRRGSEQDAIAAGYTMKAYRGVSAANPFNDTGTTWLTTSREVAEVYANEVMGYDDPDVLTVMVRPDDLPRRDASRLTDEEREGLQADEFGNPQAIGIYDRSDDHPLGGSRRNVTVIHAPQEAVWLVDDTVALSRAPAANPSTWESVRDAKLPAGYIVNDFIAKHGKLSWWSKTVGTMHNLAQRSPEFKRVYDAVQNFLGDVSLYATEAANEAPNLLPKLETFRDITKTPLSAEDTKAIAGPIFEGTLSWTRDENGEPVPEDDPQKAGIVWTDAELRDRFKLGDRQIKLYREFRSAVDKSLTDLIISDMLRYAGKDAEPVRAQVLASESAGEAASILQEHLAALAETAGKDRAATLSETGATIGDKAAQAERLIQRGYAPLTRFGHYTLDVVDENGDRVYFGLFESEAEANRMARKLREGFPGAQVTQGTLSERAYQLFAGVSPETLELFGNLLGLESQGDDAASLAFQEYLKLAKSNRSALKRLIERKGIAGFSEDAGRVLAGFVYSNARQTAKNLHFGAITEATQAIADTKGKGELLDAAVDLHQYVTNPREEAQKIKGLLFAQFLGGSIASAMVNLTQPVAVAFPYLSQWGGASKAARRVTAALKDALAWETASPSNRTTGDKALDAAMKRAEEEGIVSPQEVHQLIAQAGGSGALEAGDGTVWGDALAKASNFRSKFMLAWGRPFSLAEQFNRRATYIAAYRTAVEEGQSDPAGFAKQAIADTMFTYNRGNRPAWARGAIGGTLFAFKTYSISYVELMARLAQSGPEGRKAALIGLATLMLMSGLQGLPGAEDLDDLIDGAMQRLGYNWSTKTAKREFFASILGEDGARFVMTGLSGLPGAPIDVSGRLGLGNFIPGTGLLTKKDDYTRDALEILGPVGSLAKQFGTAAGKIAEGDVVAGIKAALPVAAANAVKAADMASMGMYRDDRGRKVIDTDGADAFWKAIGFQPTDVAKVQDASFDVQRMVSQTRLREAEIADKWARGMFEGDQDLIDEARAELSRWNESNPSTRIRITSKQLLDRVKNMRMDKTERIAKTAPREIRETVRRELERTQ